MSLHQLALSSADLTFSRCSTCRVGRSPLAQAGLWPLCRRPARRCRRCARLQSTRCPPLPGACSHVVTMAVLVAGFGISLVSFCLFAAFVVWIPHLGPANCCFGTSSHPDLTFGHCFWPCFGCPRLLRVGGSPGLPCFPRCFCFGDFANLSSVRPDLAASRAWAFALLLAVCRGIGWCSWEHKFPRFVLFCFFTSPASGYKLVSDHTTIFQARFIHKHGLPAWHTSLGQRTQNSFMLLFGDETIHRVITVTKLGRGLWTERTLYLVGTPEKEEEMMANINAIRRIVQENMRTSRLPVQRAGNAPRRLAMLPGVRAFGNKNAAYSTALRAAPPQQIRRRVRSEAVARGVEEEGIEMVPLPSVGLAGGFL